MHKCIHVHSCMRTGMHTGMLDGHVRMHTNRVTRVHTYKHAYFEHSVCVCVRSESDTRARTHTVLYGYFADLPESIMVVSHAVSRKTPVHSLHECHRDTRGGG